MTMMKINPAKGSNNCLKARLSGYIGKERSDK